MPAGRKETNLEFWKEVRFQSQYPEKGSYDSTTNTTNTGWQGETIKQGGRYFFPASEAGVLNELAANRKGGTKDVRSYTVREKLLSL